MLNTEKEVRDLVSCIYECQSLLDHCINPGIQQQLKTYQEECFKDLEQKLEVIELQHARIKVVERIVFDLPDPREEMTAIEGHSDIWGEAK